MFAFCGGRPVKTNTFPKNVVEVIYDAASGRSWAQQGPGNFSLFEFDPYTGDEIPATRFSTAGVNQFHALEFVNGVLFGGGWQHLGTSAVSQWQL